MTSSLTAGGWLGPDQKVQTGSVILDDATSLKFTGWQGLQYNYAVIHFQSPQGADRLAASIAYPGTPSTLAPVHLILIDPEGRFAAHSLPYGIGNFGNVDLRFPVPGTGSALTTSSVEGSCASVVSAATNQIAIVQSNRSRIIEPPFLRLQSYQNRR